MTFQKGIGDRKPGDGIVRHYVVKTDHDRTVRLVRCLDRNEKGGNNSLVSLGSTMVITHYFFSVISSLPTVSVDLVDEDVKYERSGRFKVKTCIMKVDCNLKKKCPD